jgi:hypothetical protein
MDILYPRIIIKKTGWWLRWLGYEYKGHLLYGREYYNRDIRWSEDGTCDYFVAETKAQALREARRIKRKVTGMEVTECYPMEWDNHE